MLREPPLRRRWPDDGGDDIFLHQSELEAAGVDPTRLKGVALEFKLVEGRNGKRKAVDLRPLGDRRMAAQPARYGIAR